MPPASRVMMLLKNQSRESVVISQKAARPRIVVSRNSMAKERSQNGRKARPWKRLAGGTRPTVKPMMMATGMVTVSKSNRKLPV